MKQQSKMFSRCYGKFRKRGEILSIIYICMNLAKNGARKGPCCFARAMAAVVIILYCMLSETDQADNSSTCVVCIQVSSIPILSHNPQQSLSKLHTFLKSFDWKGLNLNSVQSVSHCSCPIAITSDKSHLKIDRKWHYIYTQYTYMQPKK